MPARPPHLLLLALGLSLSAAPADGARFEVDALDDTVDAMPGDGSCADARGSCTLRAAIQEANATPEADEIHLPAGVHVVDIAGGFEDAAATGDLDVLAPLTIVGAGADSTWIEAGPSLDDGLLARGGSAEFLRVEQLGLRGRSDLPWPGIWTPFSGELEVRHVRFEGHGGPAISTSAVSLLVEDCWFEGNLGAAVAGVQSQGGTVRRCEFLSNGGSSVTGIVRGADLVEDCRFEDNSLGGGNVVEARVVHRVSVIGTLSTAGGSACAAGEVVDSIILDNQLEGVSLRRNGGASRLVRNCSIGRNAAGLSVDLLGHDPARIEATSIFENQGTGIVTHGWRDAPSLTLVNCTISGNDSSIFGGGIYLDDAAHVEILSSTIANNVSADFAGGGLHVNGWSPGAPFDVRNTILHGNDSPTGADCGGWLYSGGSVLVGELGSCDYTRGTGDLIGADPMLEPLADNGGPAPTHALPTGSPALDAGVLPTCTDSGGVFLAQDQRGGDRHVDADGDLFAPCDIGAYEFGAEVAVEGLVEATVSLVPPGVPERVAATFQAACQVSPWRLCPEATWPGPFHEMRLAGAVLHSGEPLVTFYEHSDATPLSLTTRDGDDIVFLAP